MSNHSLRLTFIVALATTLAGSASAQANSPKTREGPSRLRQRMTPERMAAIDSLATHLERALSVRSVGLTFGDTIVALYLENWKRPLAIDTLAPLAHRGLALLLREDSSARRAKVLSARFSDYTPQVVTLSWSAADFQAHPERFRVTRNK